MLAALHKRLGLKTCTLRRDLVMAIGDAQAVICTIGSRGFDARKFEEVDRKVSTVHECMLCTCLSPFKASFHDISICASRA